MRTMISSISFFEISNLILSFKQKKLGNSCYPNLFYQLNSSTLSVEERQAVLKALSVDSTDENAVLAPWY